MSLGSTDHGTRGELLAVVGPPGAGKTRVLIDVARRAAADGERVWWLALPHQRPYVFRRLTEHGSAVLGVEVLGAQQAYYRFLSALAPERLRPLLVGTARVVAVSEALAVVSGTRPTPGEAKLFAAAIAEAKRHEVPPETMEAMVGADAEGGRLARVYAAYESLKGEAWDYDDVRSAAAAAAHDSACEGALGSARARAVAGLPDRIVVDGWRELGPLDWRFLSGVAGSVPVHVGLPALPDGLDLSGVSQLGAGPSRSKVTTYVAPNPVAEARFVLRCVKRDLACGHEPHAVAVIAEGAPGDALVALADEYGVPLSDERGRSLVTTRTGAVALDLLEAVDEPTASRLIAVPGLRVLASAALELGIAGWDALTLLASRLGLGDELARWRELLTPSGDHVQWTRWLLAEMVGPQVGRDEELEERVLVAAQHATRLGTGAAFAAWLAALLRDLPASADRGGGVPLLTPDLASGRRFERCYVVGATALSYSAREREDYFVADEWRAETRALGMLPRRFAGGDHLVVAELLTRADEVVVTAPAVTAEGRATLDPDLMAGAAPLPGVPAGSLLEHGGEVYEPPFGELGRALDCPHPPHDPRRAEWVRSVHAGCPLRAWAQAALRLDEATPTPLLETQPPPGPESLWRQLVEDISEGGELDAARLAVVASAHPWASEWLELHGEELGRLRWRPVVRYRGGLALVPDAVDAGDRRVVIYRFVGPTRDDSWQALKGTFDDRWTEVLIASMVSRGARSSVPGPRRSGGRWGRLAELAVWPVLGRPLVVQSSSRDWLRGMMDEAVSAVPRALAAVERGALDPAPSARNCAGCPVAAVCRRGVLA